jgi:hypothetical protein
MEKETKQALEIVIKKIINNKDLYDYYNRTKNDNYDKFTVEGLADLACNHLFDDYPELFGITKLQGHKIREYFHNNRGYVQEVKKEFPDYFEL